MPSTSASSEYEQNHVAVVQSEGSTSALPRRTKYFLAHRVAGDNRTIGMSHEFCRFRIGHADRPRPP